MFKEEAIKRMKAMEIAPFIIKHYEDKEDIAIFERQNSIFNAVYYGLGINEGQEEYDLLKAKIEWFERKYKTCKVYMVQKSYTEFGTQYCLFFIDSQEKDFWNDNIEELKEGYAYCYVWNKTNDMFSEFGTIGFEKAMGGIYRTC